MHDVGLVSASMDSRILLTDISREKVLHCASHHKKSVADFVWCKTYSIFASCSERTIVLWQGNTTRKVGDLLGHTTLVTQLAIDEKCAAHARAGPPTGPPAASNGQLRGRPERRTQHLMSLGSDHLVKIWDLRTNKCLQTIGEEDWARREEAKPVALLYDGTHRRLVTAVNKPYVLSLIHI